MQKTHYLSVLVVVGAMIVQTYVIIQNQPKTVVQTVVREVPVAITATPSASLTPTAALKRVVTVVPTVTRGAAVK